MTDHPTELNDLAQAASEMMAAAQTATLRMLGMEMKALAQMMPGAEHDAVQALPSEDEVEQGFENMPV